MVVVKRSPQVTKEAKIPMHTHFFSFLLVSHLLYAICQNKSPGKPRVSVGRGVDTERGIIVTIFANTFPQGHDRWKRSPGIPGNLPSTWQCARQFREA